MNIQPLVPADRWDTDHDYHLTDLGNAQRLVKRLKGRFVWVEDWKSWQMFDSIRWGRSANREIYQEVIEVVKELHMDSGRADSKDEREALRKHAATSESSRSHANMIELSKSYLAVPASKFDISDELLNLTNGTLDLKSGELLAHDPDHFITKLADYSFEPEVQCDQFEAFISRIFGADQKIIGLWQRIFGACLMGEPGFDRFFICYGTGANGKSVLLSMLRALIGDYAAQTNPQAFTSEKIDPQGFMLHQLKDKRVVTTSESGSGSKLHAALIKQALGGEPMRTAQKHGMFVSWLPRWKVFLATNHKPMIRDQDEGIWRRVLLLPFNITIPKREQTPLGQFVSELKRELPGILNWALEGLRAYRVVGLNIPQSIENENAAYKDDQDILSDWIEANCVVGPIHETVFADLYGDYSAYSEASKLYALGKGNFGSMLDQKNMPVRRTKKARFRKNICLKSACEHEIGDRGDDLNSEIRSQGDDMPPEITKTALAQPHEREKVKSASPLSPSSPLTAEKVEILPW